MTGDYRYQDIRGWQRELSGCCIPAMVILAIVLALVSCRTIQYVPVETVRTEYKTKTDTFIRKDSVHVKDSVLIKQAGDTIHYHHWHYEYVGHDETAVKNDTIIKTDSIQVPYPVERKLNKWESFCIDYGKVMVGTTATVLIILLFLVARWIAGHRRKS